MHDYMRPEAWGLVIAQGIQRNRQSFDRAPGDW